MQLQKINNKLLLIIAVFLIGFSIYQQQDNVIPIPSIPIIVPDKIELKTNIYYDEFDKCKSLAESYNRKLVIIFGADWCPYCKDLKKDTKDIKAFDSYIVCFINTDSNKTLVHQFRIKGLPTSIIIDNKENELSRKTGYKKKEYEEWLNSDLKEENFSWLQTNAINK